MANRQRLVNILAFDMERQREARKREPVCTMQACRWREKKREPACTMLACRWRDEKREPACTMQACRWREEKKYEHLKLL